MKRLIYLLPLCWLLLAGFKAHADEKENGGFQARQFSTAQGSLPYGLFLPRGYDSQRKYPLVLFLHGAGERGMDNHRQLRDILPWTREAIQSKYPCFILAPQCPHWKEVIQVYGNNNDLAVTHYRSYAGSEKQWKHFQIPIGRQYSGRMKWLFFFNDDWGKDTPLESLYRNVRVYESGQEARAQPVNFNKLELTPYAGGGRGNNPSVEDNGATLHLLGDTRKKASFPYTVTKNTILEFDFKSSFQGNLHGIGLDDDDTLTEYKWVQVDWSGVSHSLPKEPSLPLQMVMELLPAIQKEYPAIDNSRIYLTGLSMGGFGVWDLLARKPDWFAAAAPICGGADLETAYQVARVPIWDFHGGDDGVVRVDRSRNMVAALWDIGATPQYTEYPGVGHDAWVKAYQETTLPEWMFAQRKTTFVPAAPSGAKAAVQSANQVEISWKAPPESEGMIQEYHVYRDGGEIGVATNLRYIDREVSENEVHSYSIAAKGRNWQFSPKSAPVFAKIPPDTSPPRIVAVRAEGSPYLIEVVFDKAVAAKPASDTSNYTLNHGLSVNRAVLTPNLTTVLLTTSGLMPLSEYTLTVRNISDRAAKPNRLPGEIKAKFIPEFCLAAHWMLDEGEGSFCLDSSGNGNTVTFRSVDWARGKWGKALRFDGIWDHVAWSRLSQSLDLTDGLTVSCWVKKDGGFFSRQTVISKHQYYDHRTQFLLDFDDSQRVRAIVGTLDKGDIVVTGSRIDARDWHHIALTYGSDSLELYIDGVSQGKAKGSGKLMSVSEPVVLGGGHQGRDPFKGCLDNIRIYNRALNTEEIKALVQAGSE